MPGAEYIVSVMSATSFFSPSSNTVTGMTTLWSQAVGVAQYVQNGHLGTNSLAN